MRSVKRLKNMGHSSFPWSQDELAASTSSFGNALSCRLPSWAKTEALNPHHRRRSPSPDPLTLTLHCCKNVISTLVTLPTTQPHLHFASLLARAPRHQNSTRRRRPTPIISPYNDIHGDKLALPEQPIDMRIYVKRYFKIPQHHTGLSTSFHKTHTSLASQKKKEGSRSFS
jgi:hypothetical protein